MASDGSSRSTTSRIGPLLERLHDAVADHREPGAAVDPGGPEHLPAQVASNYNVSFSSYLMAMAPTVIAYIFAQRWVMSGVTRGAIK
jgi:hypothetical protein